MAAIRGMFVCAEGLMIGLADNTHKTGSEYLTWCEGYTISTEIFLFYWILLHKEDAENVL